MAGCLLAAGWLAAGECLTAAEIAAPVAGSTKLKWHARGVPPKAEPAAATPKSDPAVIPAKAEEPGTLTKAPDARPLSRKLPARTSRSRLRDAIMQVSGDLAQRPTDEPSTTDAPPAIEELPPADATAPAADAMENEPAPLRPGNDPFADEPIPTPPSSTEPYAPPPATEAFPGDLSEGISTEPGDTSCQGYGEECRRAIADLQKRTITQIVVGLEIEGVEGEDFPCDCRLGINVDAPDFPGRHFSRTNFAWKATGVCHKPLYFEDVQLERYGHSWNPVVQPFMSAAHFFVSVPLLPYNMGLNPPGECMYTLGYYRPGSCAPYLLEPIPLSLRAAIFEGLGVAGFAFWLWPG
ncbi:MAG TPA: hypothetical protein VGJ16_07765 [Pirellulales bacterium]